jgi:murein L,D-transpeptidase YcbB/YkuD
MNLTSIPLFLIFIVPFIISCASKNAKTERPSSPPLLTEQIHDRLSADIDFQIRSLNFGATSNSKTLVAYRKSNFQPLWITNNGISKSVHELVTAIEGSQFDGLDPHSYYLPSIVNLLGQLEPTNIQEYDEHVLSDLTRLDIYLTAAFLGLTADIRQGKVNPSSVDPEWFIPDKKDTNLISADLKTIANPESLREYIKSLYPPVLEYARLRDAMKSYKALLRINTWPILPSDLKLKPGDHDQTNIPLLRERLRSSRDLPETINNQTEIDLFGPDLEVGLRTFQQRHGLDPNGVLNSETIRELNIPIEDRISQIEVNMERWRWLPHDLGQSYVVVNVADYRLSIMENQHALHLMNAVVGQEFRRTPSFQSQIVAIEINPKR